MKMMTMMMMVRHRMMNKKRKENVTSRARIGNGFWRGQMKKRRRDHPGSGKFEKLWIPIGSPFF